MVFQHFRFWAHQARTCMHHTCLSCLEAHLFPFCSFFTPFWTKKRSFSAIPWHSWNAFRSLGPSKSSGKTNGFSTFSLFGPTKPPHICIILAISCLEAHLFSVLLLFWSLFQPKTTYFQFTKLRSLKASKPRGASAGIAKRIQFTNLIADVNHL